MKKFIKCLSFILMVGIICISLVGCKSKKDKADEEKNDNYLMCTENESNGINLKMKRLSNVSTQSTSGDIEIVAIVNPSDAVNKKLTWTLTWKTSKSDSISDYVTKSVSSDTLTCTLTYVKNFDTQIILKATSDANSSISATCTIDCYKRTQGINSLKLTIDFNGSMIEGDSFGDSIDYVDYEELNFDDLSYYTFDLSNSNISLNRIGTVDSNTTIKYYLTLSSNLKTYLTNNGITCNSTVFELEDANISILDVFNDLCTINSQDNFKKALSSYAYWFDLRIVVSENNVTESYTKTYSMIGFNLVESEIKSISFNNSSVIF